MTATGTALPPGGPDILLTPGRPRKFLLAERARAELGLPRPGS
jgi:hypothetical protein